MSRRLKWGVLGAAKIAVNKVIPAMQRGARSTVVAIGSRDRLKAEQAAHELNIPRAYGSYEAVLADPDVEAVYIPLPNHLHVPWTLRSTEAGKHVLCEKPIALTEDQARELLSVRDRTGLTVQEAFMVRTHPQWTTALDLLHSGALGELRAMTGVFSYFNDDGANIRNVAAYGGGALMDIGCYLVMTSRLMFGRDPVRVQALVSRDPRFGTDRLTSMLLDYEGATFAGTCATQMAASQHIQVSGTHGRIEIEVPFNPAPDEPAWLTFEKTGRSHEPGERIATAPCNQYTIQGDRFAASVLDGVEQVYALEESVANMRVIDALVDSARTGRWTEPGRFR